MATYLLIHGACHGGWCWERVAPLLEERGHDVIAPDLPSEDVSAGLREYADCAEDALAGTRGEIVVVGHSLGALTASVIAARRPVRRLTFVGGIIGQPNRTLEELAEIDSDRDMPLTPEDFEQDDSGRFCFTPSGARRALYQDCPEDVAAAAIARLRLQRSLWRVRAPFDSWPDCEISSILCSDDRIVNPAWLRRVSIERLGVKPVELGGGHSPFLSRAERLAALLTEGV